MTAIKPGTRCECCDPKCPAEGPMGGHHAPCANDAVRLVTNVERSATEWYGTPRRGTVQVHGVPMCSACSSFHEAENGDR